ncbi:MAG: MTH938/NDUFAF3 family protein [candidate division WOR-3 bacterium]
MTLRATGFGWIETDSGRIDSDVIIFPDGRVANRYDHLRGSNHTVLPAEAELVLDRTAATLVIGTGHYGVVQVPAETRSWLDARRVKLVAAPTPEAVARYNELPEPKAAILHVTC